MDEGNQFFILGSVCSRFSMTMIGFILFTIANTSLFKTNYGIRVYAINRQYNFNFRV